MAKCDEGYRCEVCGNDVEIITESDLYLRYILGEVPLEVLHLQKERHLHCNPALTQYIVDSRFTPVECVGPFDKRSFPKDYVTQEEHRVTLAFRRLQAIPTLGLSIAEYPFSITPVRPEEETPCDS